MVFQTVKKMLLRQYNFSTDAIYGRKIISSWIKESCFSFRNDREISVLDIGCGEGKDLKNARLALSEREVSLYGVDFKRKADITSFEKQINVKIIDIERQAFPFKSESFDFIIANQVFEHLKEIFWVLSECARVLKSEGFLIVGIPNLAAFHNRILVLLGRQPVCMHVVGPHVRGFSFKEFKDFLETGNSFKVNKTDACNVFPFPKALARYILKLFPGLGITLLFLCAVNKQGNILKSIADKGFETNYFLGS